MAAGMESNAIPTGFKDLDSIVGGLYPGELTVIAGRPGMGKTALCWSIANSIKQSGKKVRIVALKYGYIDLINPFEIETFDYCYDGLSLSKALDAMSETHEVYGKYDILIFTALYPANSRAAHDIYSSLKKFAAAEGIAVIIEDAVSRTVERTDTYRPSIEHLKYPKPVERYADNTLFVYREGYYDASVDSSIFEVIVAKSSLGQRGSALLRFEIVEIPVTVRVPIITE